MEKIYSVLFEDGHKESLKYEEVCRRLGFIPETHFIEINPRWGSIGFTIGKPEEITALACAVKREGMVSTKKLAGKKCQ